MDMDVVEVKDRSSTKDVIAERERQIGKWDDDNAAQAPSRNLSWYLGIVSYYTGTAGPSYHNGSLAQKRAQLVKAAATLLQTVDRIDDGTITGE